MIVASLPMGADRCILRVLSFHVGRSRAVVKGELLQRVRDHGFDLGEREIRAAINQLRKDGHLICSVGGTGGGYYMAGTALELEEFLERELHSRAMDLLEQEKALRGAARKVWGEGVQLQLV